MRIQFML